MKRRRQAGQKHEDEGRPADAPVRRSGHGGESDMEVEESDEDVDEAVYGGGSGTGRRRKDVEQRRECPYLDTVNRQVLDFDFEKFCSVSLSNLNVYGCLVCGKYYQGRGPRSHAYTHSLDSGHHIFINLSTERVYCLPDGYEVIDPSLESIQHVLNPRFSREQVAQMDSNKLWSRALDGSDYIPGMVGLNNIKETDFFNAVIQALSRVTVIRDFFLVVDNYRHCKSPLVQRFGEMLRKTWHAGNFKGQVSPHELLQAVMVASKKRFRIGVPSDVVEFMTWLLNALHHDLGGTRKRDSSIIYRCFQGELEVITEATTSKATKRGDTTEGGKGEEGGAHAKQEEEGSDGRGEGLDRVRMPFMMLGLDLPPPPLFKDVMEKNIIPQVPLFQIIKKFDGTTVHEDVKLGRRRYRITRLPRYLILHMKRFTKNNFFVEKNPTIVNFPVKNLELKDYVPVPSESDGTTKSKYDLVANIVHDGKPDEGTYRVFVHRKSEDTWYEMQDLHVVETLPQMVALSEAYVQIYELQQPSASEPPTEAAESAENGQAAVARE